MILFFSFFNRFHKHDKHFQYLNVYINTQGVIQFLSIIIIKLMKNRYHQIWELDLKLFLTLSYLTILWHLAPCKILLIKLLVLQS